MPRRIVVGTCGFCVSHRRYFHTFPVIEIQQVFYQPPQEHVLVRWRTEAPEEFEFTLKAFQAITHPAQSPTWRRSRLPVQDRLEAGFFRDTNVVREAWRTTKRVADILRASTVIFQCPPRFDACPEHVAQLRWFFTWAERGTLQFGLETRHPSWLPKLPHLCRTLELIDVVDPFVRQPVTPSPRYFRLHGIGGYNYSYAARELQRLRDFCRGQLTYCLFNNTAMYENAVQFQEIVKSDQPKRSRG